MYNLEQKNCGLFYFLTELVLSTSHTKPGYYQQKMNVRVSSPVEGRLKTQDLRKLGIFRKIPELLGFHGEDPAVHQKAKF